MNITRILVSGVILGAMSLGSFAGDNPATLHPADRAAAPLQSAASASKKPVRRAAHAHATNTHPKKLVQRCDSGNC